ncbi:MAG TPA: beta-ketoacyl-[acyl-carrier-protein] synthase family protein [Pirellulales bacterium]|nr:beta-ketoacyl-[acyl-carrier-protein] synthase family protein [Pirellulales bacterium]
MPVNTSERRNVRVVITGIGLITPLGNSKEALWQNLSNGRSGVGPITSLPPDALPVNFAAEARDFSGHVDNFGPLEGEQKKQVRKGLKIMCRECQMGVAAAQLALGDARLGLGKCDPDRTGVVFGSDYMLTMPDEFTAGVVDCLDDAGQFHFSRWATQGMSKMNPLWLLKYLPNMPASHIAIYNDLRGPNNSLTHREASGNLAVGEAFRVIVRGHADAMIAGATGTRVHPMKAVHAALAERLAEGGDDPTQAARPFDLHRGGMVLGEGAGAVVLESLESAEKRGATIYGEVVAAASSAVSGRDLTADCTLALANSMRAALREARLTPQHVGHLHAHGLGTRHSDVYESRAVRDVFGQQADHVPVTAAKSYFGNLGAGGGLVELIASTLALKHRQLFPVLNYKTPDPDCRLNVVAAAPGDPGDNCMNLSFTPQGQASCVIARRFGES